MEVVLRPHVVDHDLVLARLDAAGAVERDVEAGAHRPVHRVIGKTGAGERERDKASHAGCDHEPVRASHQPTALTTKPRRSFACASER
jgi:hypothetical protein